jgi:diguanylate cyclase (GGDEF)-like protein/PAS domain S-box-containing protein
MGLIHEWNSLATELFGIEAYSAFFNTVSDVLDPDGVGTWDREVVNQIFTTDRGAEFDWTFTRDDGRVVHLACKVLCLTNRKGDVIAAVAGNLDITERVQAQKKIEEQVREIKSYLKVMERQRLKLQDANRQLRRLAVTDGLTGLMNRRRFNELLDESLDRAMRQNQIFSIILFDIDHFKKLNDEFGHNAGDEILVKFANVLKDAARRYERPARYGGEEFAIVLDNCDAHGARLAAERFRTAVNGEDWPYRDITVSVGCSTFSGVESARGMIEFADEALYFAKSQGRNRVAHHRDIPRGTQQDSIKIA